MKKVFSIFVALLLLSIPVQAKDNPLRLKSGSLTALKQKGSTISFSADFSKTKGNRKPLTQYIVEDFESSMDVFDRYVPEMLQWFEERWDDDIEGGAKSSNSDNTDFHCNIVIKTLQMGSKSGYGGGSSISGYAQFYKRGEAEPFAEVEILKMNGTIMGGAVWGYPGLKQCFSDLAEYLCDLIYKSK